MRATFLLTPKCSPPSSLMSFSSSSAHSQHSFSSILSSLLLPVLFRPLVVPQPTLFIPFMTILFTPYILPPDLSFPPPFPLISTSFLVLSTALHPFTCPLVCPYLSFFLFLCPICFFPIISLPFSASFSPAQPTPAPRLDIKGTPYSDTGFPKAGGGSRWPGPFKSAW